MAEDSRFVADQTGNVLDSENFRLEISYEIQVVGGPSTGVEGDKNSDSLAHEI